jgi:hypothetical protein
MTNPLTSHFSLLTSHLSLLLRIPGRECHPAGQLAVETDLERVLARAGEGDVEDQHGARLDVHYAGGRLSELHGAFAPEELGTGFINETNTDRVSADLGAASSNPKHEMGARVDRGKVREPDVLKHAEHAELALLVDQGVVRDDCEIEVQGSGDSD